MTIYSTQEIQRKDTRVKEVILLAHTFTGCDSSSSIFGKGKLTGYKLPLTGNLESAIKVFAKRNSSQEAVRDSGNEIFSAMYSLPDNVQLNKFCFPLYAHLGQTSRKIDLRLLCPTQGAAMQHSLCVYCQVQA